MDRFHFPISLRWARGRLLVKYKAMFFLRFKVHLNWMKTLKRFILKLNWMKSKLIWNILKALRNNKNNEKRISNFKNIKAFIIKKVFTKLLESLF